ncbi:hypothetical protein C8J57DRAFT_1232092 [Mycena rebaudengoi]|nr:hypothetical protein C8J57DRAFT_1232092 [Mycena rebaudengoi]
MPSVNSPNTCGPTNSKIFECNTLQERQSPTTTTSAENQRKTSVIAPIITIQYQWTPEERNATGVTDDMIPYSVGIWASPPISKGAESRIRLNLYSAATRKKSNAATPGQEIQSQKIQNSEGAEIQPSWGVSSWIVMMISERGWVLQRPDSCRRILSSRYTGKWVFHVGESAQPGASVDPDTGCGPKPWDSSRPEA